MTQPPDKTSNTSPDGQGALAAARIDPEHLLTHDAFVRGLARSLVQDEHSANDLAQDTWLAAIENAPQEPRSLRAWLRRVVHYLAGKRRLGEVRRKARQRRAAKPDYIPSAAEIVERETARRQVVRAVLKLKEPYRSTMLLRFFENLPPREVARRMKVPVETVRTRTRRALTILRERLDKLHDGDRQSWCLLLAPFIPTPTPMAVATGAAGHAMTKVAGITGILIMTTKAKLAAVAAVCGVLLGTLWVLQEPSSHDGLPRDPSGSASTGPLVAGGETTHKVSTTPGKDAPERTKVSRSVTKPHLGSLLVRVTWAKDKTRAASVFVTTLPLLAQGYGDLLFDTTRALTGPDGTLRIEDLEPGVMFVACSWGAENFGRKRVAIEAGKEIQVDLVIPVGFNVDGIVVDQTGTPVAGADILIGNWGPVPAYAASKTGPGGRFRLRSLIEACCVGARAPGHAPSGMHMLFGRKGTNLKIRMVLGGRGGALKGRILDPRGEPVADAVMQFGMPKYDSIKLPDGSRGRSPMPIRPRSDADGRFLVEGLPPGKNTLAVRARGLAPWTGSVDVLAGGNSELVVRLLPGVTLTGTAQDANGRPLEKVMLSVGDFHTLNSTLAYHRTGTDADGSYRLEGLGPGKLKVEATSVEGKAETELVAVAGQTLRWDPVITKGLVLRGRVVDEDDQPVKAYVAANLANPGSEDGWYSAARTDKDGWFELKNCRPGKAIRLGVQWPAYGGERIVYVKPDSQDLVIRVPSVAKPTVYLTGRMLNEDGKPVETGFIRLYDRQGGFQQRQLTLEAATGRFKAGPFPPGEYRVQVQANSTRVLRTDWKKLTHDETLDLGVIRLQRPGFLQVTLAGKAELLPEKGSFRILDPAKAYVQSIWIRERNALRSKPLAPGIYYLQVLGKEFLCDLRRFEIQPAEETRVEVPLAKGTPVVLEFVLHTDVGIAVPGGGASPWESTHVEIQNDSGRRILAGTPYAPRLGPPKFVFAVQPGKYRINATHSSGRRADIPLTVGDKPVGLKRIVLR